MASNQSLEQSWAEFKKWWSSPNNAYDIKSNEENFTDHPLFTQAMAMSRSMLSVIDLRTMQFLFMTGDVEAITGWNKAISMEGGVRISYEQIHEADRILGSMFGQIMSAYFKALPEEQKHDYKSYWDWRFVRPDGASSRVLSQESILKHDAEGNMILLLSFVTEIASLKSDRCNHLRLTNGAENILYEYNQTDKKNYTLECPSDRELDVFRHISQGYQRKQIADKLGITLATVKTHCQNTFEKLRTNDSVETINLLRIFGLL